MTQELAIHYLAVALAVVVGCSAFLVWIGSIYTLLDGLAAGRVRATAWCITLTGLTVIIVSLIVWFIRLPPGNVPWNGGSQ